jgi:hypothetical protein
LHSPHREPDQYEHTATLKGTLSGGGGYPLGWTESAIVTFVAPQGSLQRGVQSHGGPSYGPFPLGWDGPGEITGRLRVLREVRQHGDAGAGTQRGSFSFSDQPVTVKAGESVTVDVELRPMPIAHQLGTVAVPDGYPVTEIDEFFRLPAGTAAGASLDLDDERSGRVASFDFEVPDLGGLGGTRCVHAIGGHATLLAATECDVPLGTPVSLTLQPPPRLSEPGDGNVGSPSTRFSWTPFDKGVYELWLIPEKASRATPMIYVHTSQTTVSWPDLRPFGVAFPEETTSYRCKISARGPFSGIDEMIAPRGPNASAHTVERLSSSAPITLRIAAIADSGAPPFHP